MRSGQQRVLVAGVTHAVGELREDGAGIAARTVQCRIGDDFRQPVGVRLAVLQQRGPHSPQHDGEIGTGVAVGHGKYVDAVEVLCVCRDPRNAGQQAARKARAVEIGDAGD